MNRIERIAQALKAGHKIETKTFAVGDGEWSIEVWANGSPICEFVGPNGSYEWESQADLWSEYKAAIDAALEMIGEPRQVAGEARFCNSGNRRV